MKAELLKVKIKGVTENEVESSLAQQKLRFSVYIQL